MEKTDKDEILKIVNGYLKDEIARQTETKSSTVRLDIKTRICLMAAFIYGTGDFGEENPKKMTIEQAVQLAIEIENLSDSRVKKMKSENPITPLRKLRERART